MATIKGAPGSRIRLILGETGSSYLLVLNEDDGTQTFKWQGMPNAICKQINNCSFKGRTVKELDCSSAVGAWYVEGIKRNGTGGHSWWGSTEASSSINDGCKYDRKVSFGSKDSCFYGRAEEMYVVITGSNGFSFSNIPMDLQERITQIHERRKKIDFIRLFDNGGYFISDSEGSQWNGIGQHVSDELEGSGGCARDVAVAKDGSWVVIRDHKFASSTGVAEELTRELASFYSRVREAERKRLAKEAAERERIEREAREEAERLIREAAERERIEREAREERERLIKEAAERERIEREAREEQERIEREAREERERLIREAAERAEIEAQRLVLELKEDCKEVEVLEKLVKKRKQDILIRLESLPPSRRVCVKEETADWKEPSSSKVECVICHDGEVVQAMVPCGHHCLCNVCAVHIMNSVPRTCPLCREVVQMTLKIYRSI
jgi:hypothetical protein